MNKGNNHTDRPKRTFEEVNKFVHGITNLKDQAMSKEHVLGNIFACATAYQLRSILRLKLKECGFDTSV